MLLLFSHHDPDDTPAREWLAEAARAVERAEDRMDEQQVLEVLASVDRLLEISEQQLADCGRLMRDMSTLLAALEHGQRFSAAEFKKRRELAAAGAELLTTAARNQREARLELVGGGTPPAA